MSLGVEVSRRPLGRVLARPLFAALAVCSLMATVSIRLLWGSPAPSNAALVIWPLAEAAVLMTVAGIATRNARGRVDFSVLLLTLAAIAVVPTRFVGAFGFGVHVFWVAVGLIPAFIAVIAGGYLRAQDTERDARVRDAARRQRLQLARDLHDFVAHDLSGMVVQAQAARLSARESPEAALDALAVIEQTGLHALAATDRAIRALDDEVESEPPLTLPGIADIEGLVRRFSTTTGVRANLVKDDDLAALTPEFDNLAYRVVVEALTNALRHGHRDSPTTVALADAEDELIIEVRNHLPDDQDEPAADGDGTGLTGIRDKLERGGGSLSAGPYPSPDGGREWILRASLPIGAAT